MAWKEMQNWQEW